MQKVYFDHNATTAIDKKSLRRHDALYGNATRQSYKSAQLW
jgi:hypothetical protein